MQQSVDFVSVIPIKKRRFPILESASISSKEIGKEEIFNAVSDKSDLSKSTAIAIATSANVENPESETKKPEPAINSDPTVDLSNKVGSFITEECAKEDVNTVVDTMAVKQENELPLVPETVVRHCSEPQNSENKCGKADGADSLSLSLDPSKEKIDACDKIDQIGIKDHEDSRSSANRSNWDLSKEKIEACNKNDQIGIKDHEDSRANRSNWDLNTSMEDWEGSTNNDSVSGMSEFSNVTSSSNHDVKTAVGVVGFGLTTGEHTLKKCSSMTSLLPSQGNEVGDSLGLSLGVSSREFGASGKQSFMPKQSDTNRVGPNLNKQNSVTSLAIRMTVKSEPVTEVSQSEFSTKSSNSEMGLSNSTSIKREVAEKQIGPQKLVEHGSIKSELIHERNNETSKLNDFVRLQHVGKVMQHQESTASSSGMTVPLMPQNPRPTSSTGTELNISKEHTQFSFHSEEVVNQMTKLHEQITAVVSEPFSQDGQCNEGNLSVENPEKLEPTPRDGRSSESRGKTEIVANEEEKINLSTEMFEEDFLGSDSESCENRGLSTPKKISNKEDGEYEEGEVRTPLQNSIREGSSANTKKTGKDLSFLQPFVLSGDQSTSASDYDVKSAIFANHQDIHSDHIKECVISGYELKNEENSAEKMAVNDPEIKFDDKRPVGVTIEKRVDFSRLHAIKKGPCEEVNDEGPSTGLVDRATDTVNKQICYAKHDLTLSTVEESNESGAANDSNYAAGNKSRIINLPRASAETSYKTRFFPNREFASSSGNDRNSDFDWDTQPRGNRNVHYSDKFEKDRARDPSFRNSRPRFMRGKGRGYGRFGPSRNDWNSDKDFATETYNSPSNYRGNRNKHTSSDSDRGGYRRNVINDEKFVRHLPEDTIDPSYNHSQNMYEEFDGQLIRDKRNFSAVQRKGYPQMTSKSPVRSRTRSPGPWPPRRRRSPDGIQELNQHRSPPVYRMRRLRSPDRSYPEEMVSRRRGGSPPFITRHSDDLRDVDSHVHPRSFTSTRRSPPNRVFPRSERRDVLDAREVGDVSIEERRKFIERRGPINPLRPSYNGDGDNFHFQHNDSPRPYRFCPDGNTEFAERSNMREREFDERNSVRVREFDERNNMREMEFDGRMKKQPLVASRRIRGDIEEQHEGSYRPKGRVWRDDGFDDVSEQKRRRF